MVVTTGGGTTQMVETRVEIRKVHFLFEPVVWICGPLIIVGIVQYPDGYQFSVFEYEEGLKDQREAWIDLHQETLSNPE